jgi:uncharacterized membrane protein
MSRTSCRILALLLWAAAGAAFFMHDIWRERLMGKAAFVQHQAQRYDKNLAISSHPLVHSIGFFVIVTLGFALYEAWVLLITSLCASRSNTL